MEETSFFRFGSSALAGLAPIVVATLKRRRPYCSGGLRLTYPVGLESVVRAIGS